ncbi:YqgQ family protein [Piscibacillus halophilus]|uniref:YqgQ family protein n=1 Tax=Piscibacillus halophilus TaxID=571933 RepID=UPI00240A8163|nr:YqgQ family protein [Piscibacillus halophilus]
MNNIIDVRSLLKQYGIFVYIGDRRADLSLMKDEIKSLYENKLISSDEYMKSLMIIKNERKGLE